MANEHDGHQHQPEPQHAHFVVCPEIFPKPDDSPEDWMARTTMLAEMAEQLASAAYMWLRINAPILAQYDSLPAQLIASIGVVCRGIRDTGREQLEKAGIEPLNVEEDQARMARDRLANPATPIEEREFLLGMLAHKLECESRQQTREPETSNSPLPADEEWPTELIIPEDPAK